MNAIVTKNLKKGIKTITGEVLYNSTSKVTVVVTDKNGNKSIKNFNKDNYIVKVY